MKKKVAVLGATGSIGKSTLDILRKESESFEPVLFSANKNHKALIEIKNDYPQAKTVLSCDETKDIKGIDFFGKQGLLDAIASTEMDICVNGISGAAGLEPSAAVLNAASDLALANKETIVMAGPLILELAHSRNKNIIPVDSEHSAIFKLIEAHGRENISEIILTASGGPFKDHSIEQLYNVTANEALAHPTWKMGPKITIDSATMANKGLEVIEAARLFGFPCEKIKVAIHPQSIVHSMIRLKNGAVYAQMSKPDMRLPIHEALSWPQTKDSSFGSLEFDNLHLSFETPDQRKFPLLSLAYDSLRGSSHLPIVYNAANEIAVAAFLESKIRFLEISVIVDYVMYKSKSLAGEEWSLETILKQDREARNMALDYINDGKR